MRYDPPHPHDVENGSMRACIRWGVLLVVAVSVCAGTYYLMVRTQRGQTIEDYALAGADQIGSNARLRAGDFLSQMSIGSLIITTIVVTAIALLRGRPLLALAGAAIVVGGQVVAQPLKSELTRPGLLTATGAPDHNSFPSGHSAIAASIVCALLLVVPYRLRGIVGIAGVIGATAISTYTVVAKWHRFSDTVGDGLSARVGRFRSAAAVGRVLGIVLEACGAIRLQVVAPGDGNTVLRNTALAALATGAIAVFAAGVLVIYDGWNRTPLDWVSSDRFLLGSQLLAAATTVLALLAFWATLYRLDLAPRRRVALGGKAVLRV